MDNNNFINPNLNADDMRLCMETKLLSVGHPKGMYYGTGATTTVGEKNYIKTNVVDPIDANGTYNSSLLYYDENLQGVQPSSDKLLQWRTTGVHLNILAGTHGTGDSFFYIKGSYSSSKDTVLQNIGLYRGNLLSDNERSNQVTLTFENCDKALANDNVQQSILTGNNIPVGLYAGSSFYTAAYLHFGNVQMTSAEGKKINITSDPEATGRSVSMIGHIKGYDTYGPIIVLEENITDGINFMNAE